MFSAKWHDGHFPRPGGSGTLQCPFSGFVKAQWGLVPLQSISFHLKFKEELRLSVSAPYSMSITEITMSASQR